jgi:hypothetical protein
MSTARIFEVLRGEERECSVVGGFKNYSEVLFCPAMAFTACAAFLINI